MSEKQYFQDYLPGNVCFGCGNDNQLGMQIKSYWDGDIARCDWQPQLHHQGWAKLTCGGVIATIVDCHCIATAMATAYRNENRTLDSEPWYLFATGSINIRYLLPSSVDKKLQLEAKVTEIKNDKKYSLQCDVYTDGEKTADAKVIALLVSRSDRPEQAPPGFALDPAR
jgi:acyl-CoA thioesterase FadM